MKSIIFGVIAAIGLTVAGSAMAEDAPAPAEAAPAAAVVPAGSDPIFAANKVEIPAERLAIIKASKFLCHTCHKI